MINTSTDIFGEGEGKTAEFIAYLTDRIPYFDEIEKKYFLLDRKEISERIKKANSEGDDLKVLDLLGAAKKTSAGPTKVQSAEIISKSVRVPGDVHLKLLVESYASHPSGKGVAVSDSLRKVVIDSIGSVLKDLKKLKGLNTEKLQRIARTFEIWEKSAKSKAQEEHMVVRESRAASYGEIKADPKESVAGMEYRTVFSSEYAEYNKKFVDTLHVLTLLKIRKELEQEISADNLDKIISAIRIDHDSVENCLDTPEEYQVFSATSIDTKTKDFLLSFKFFLVFVVDDPELLEKEIGVTDFNKFVDKKDYSEGDLFFDFSYKAPISIRDDKILFKSILLSEENKNKIRKEILNDLCAEYHVVLCDIDEVNAKVEKLVEKGNFEKAEVLKRQVVDCQRAVYLAGCLAESLLDVPRTSKVVTHTMPAGLLGLFEAYSEPILASLKSKKSGERAVQ